MRVRAAVVGGTGVGALFANPGDRPIHIPTRYGTIRGRLRPDGILALSRHGATHATPPHLVNYLALAAAVHQVGAKSCLATAAVGSLRADWPPGTVAVVSDFIDVSGRRITRFESGISHTDFSTPVSDLSRTALIASAAANGATCETRAIYANVDGPRYETPAEVAALRALGADVVGMTIGSEAIAMRELGIDYACVAVVTNLGTGLSAESLNHEEVVEEMAAVGPCIAKLVLEAAARIGN